MKLWLRAFALLFVICQVSYSSAKDFPDYTRYYNGILAAEHHLAAGELPAAFEAYRAAFSDYNFVFARDAYNALQLAIITKQHDADRNEMLLRCALSGVPEQLLRRNTVISAAFASDEAIFDSLLKKGNASYLQQIDTSLKNEMQQRYATEQASKGTSDYSAVVTDNFNRIAALCKQGRFPGEQVIGVDGRLGYGIVLPSLLHYTYAYVRLYDCLQTALHRGQIPPSSLMYLYSFNQTRTSVLYTDDIPRDTQHFNVCYNYYFGLQSADHAAVDSARTKVWLPPLGESEQIKTVARKWGMDYRDGM